MFLKDMINNFKNTANLVNHKQVYVGVINDSQREGGMSNAELLYLHENGVPSHNIPPRPVVNITLQDGGLKAQTGLQMAHAIGASLIGHQSKAEAIYESIGNDIAEAVKNNFGTDKLVPNAPATIAKKGRNSPLIDTGQLKDSISYEVRDD